MMNKRVPIVDRRDFTRVRSQNGIKVDHQTGPRQPDGERQSGDPVELLFINDDLRALYNIMQG